MAKVKGETILVGGIAAAAVVAGIAFAEPQSGIGQAVGELFSKTGLISGSPDKPIFDNASPCRNVGGYNLNALDPSTIESQGGMRFGGKPTISCIDFYDTLVSAHSPAATEGTAIYLELIKANQNPAAYLAEFGTLSKFGTSSAAAAQSENWCRMQDAWTGYHAATIGSGVEKYADFSSHGGWEEGVRQCILMTKAHSAQAHSDSVAAVLAIETNKAHTAEIVADTEKFMRAHDGR